MARKKYTYENLIRHSDSISLSSRKLLKHDIDKIKGAFSFLDQHFSYLESLPKSLQKNVKMALSCRFINHLFSYFTLVERGLYFDAANCLRSATEVIAMYWLVCVDETTASLYDNEKSPRPVEIRKKLESIGCDITDIRETYGTLSGISHVGNKNDSLHIDWIDAGQDGLLQVGGGQNSERQKQMLEDINRALLLFIRYEDQYEISCSE